MGVVVTWMNRIYGIGRGCDDAGGIYRQVADTGFGESQGAQSFFNDLCALAGHPTPGGIRQPGSLYL